MRIDLSGVGADAAIGPAKGAAAKLPPRAGTDEAISVPQDTASLSRDQKSIPALTAQALATAGTREARVEALRQAVGGASYAVDPAAIADAMVSDSEVAGGRLGA